MYVFLMEIWFKGSLLTQVQLGLELIRLVDGLGSLGLRREIARVCSCACAHA
jgi:hypothetical protein